MQWQPIKTAPKVTFREYCKAEDAFFASEGDVEYPKSDRPLLLWGSPYFFETGDLGKPRCFVGYWSMMYDDWVEMMQGMTDEAISSYRLHPTHWMPLPAAPNVEV